MLLPMQVNHKNFPHWIFVATFGDCDSAQNPTNLNMLHIVECRILYWILYMKSELALNQKIKSFSH